jgi:hypothetical protein
MSIVAAVAEWHLDFKPNSLIDFDTYRFTFPSTTDRKVVDDLAKQLMRDGYKDVRMVLSVSTP